MAEESNQETKTEPDEGASARRDELDAALRAWDERPPEEDSSLLMDARPYRVDTQRLWITLGLGLAVMSLWALWLTRLEVAYWAQKGEPPRDLGSLKERYLSGERELDFPSNVYVKVDGVFSSYEAEGSSTRGGATKLHRFYLDPLFHVVVRTSKPTLDKPYHRAASLEVDEGFLNILEERRAFPYDLVVSSDASGRLIRAVDAPRWHRKPLRYFASVARLDPKNMWLLLEDDPPEAYGGYVLIWAAAILLALSSLTLVAISVRRRRQRAGA